MVSTAPSPPPLPFLVPPSPCTFNFPQGVVEAAIPWLSASLCTLGTVTVPSAASVYNEYALKKHMDTSVHLQNFFLYFYGAWGPGPPIIACCGGRVFGS